MPLARLERPLLGAGLLLISLHLLDLALSGPASAPLAVALIVAVPAALWIAAPRASRLTRSALALITGLAITAMAAVSDTLHAVTAGPQWADVSGIGATAGGLLLATAGVAALAAPRKRPVRSTKARAAYAVAWSAGAVLTVQIVLVPVLALGFWTSHAPRLPVHGADLGLPHEDVRIAAPGGGELTAWYVPSRTGAAVLLTHGSSGNRARVAAQARMLARHGVGVLALDQPGNGGSDGRSSGLGYNAQPALAAAVGYLQRRPDVDPDRIGAYGLSLGGEVLLEAAARDPRIHAVVSEGAERASDDVRLGKTGGPVTRAQTWLGLQIVRGISGMRPAPPLLDLLPRIAPRPVLLIAGGSRPNEIAVNREYARVAGPAACLWALPDAAHTGGLQARGREYERRVAGFLARALGAVPSPPPCSTM